MSGVGDLPTGLGPSLSNRRLAAGEVLFNQGDLSDRAYILESGLMEVSAARRYC